MVLFFHCFWNDNASSRARFLYKKAFLRYEKFKLSRVQQASPELCALHYLLRNKREPKDRHGRTSKLEPEQLADLESFPLI